MKHKRILDNEGETKPQSWGKEQERYINNLPDFEELDETWEVEEAKGARKCE